MQSSAALSLVLCAIASFTDAAYHHSSHRRPSGYGHSILPSVDGPFASGSGIPVSTLPKAPYPIGNGTVGGSTGTGTASISITTTAALDSMIYVSSLGEAQSPISTDGGRGPSEEVSSCDLPVIITVTQEATITSTMAAVPAQSPLESQSAPLNQPPSQSQQSSNPLPVASSIPSVAPAAGEAQVPNASSASTISAPEKIVSQLRALGVVLSPAVSATVAVPASAKIVASTSSTKPSSAQTGGNGLIPNGVKAGVAGYRSITDKSSWSQFTPHIGWYSDYWPDTPDSVTVTGVRMVSDRQLLSDFRIADPYLFSSGVTATRVVMTPTVSLPSKP